MKRITSMLLAVLFLLTLAACGNTNTDESSEPEPSQTQTPASSAALSSAVAATPEPVNSSKAEEQEMNLPVPENFVLITGGAFDMGSPDTEPWRGKDETQHQVTVSSFYMDAFELTQEEYQTVMGQNPSNFSGERLPVYPNWWASIPMPIATFLEEYDFAGKTIVPFCSHGGGRFGQSLTAIAKLAPDADMGEGLAINYSGGASMPDDVAGWLNTNEIELD